jgi:hypothetical protein
MTTNSRTATELKNALLAIVDELKALDAPGTIADAELVPLIKAVTDVGAFSATLHARIEMLAIAQGVAVPGVALKDEVKHRVWNDKAEVEKLAQSQFGDKAFKRELLSPAGIEKLGTEGKALVSMCSSKPPAGKKVVY